jgi:large subunit ribosomal protein L9
MKVILTKDIETLGSFGEVVNVSDGYARNFLIPKGVVLTFTPQNLKVIEEKKKKHELQIKKRKEEAEVLAQKLPAVSITIPVKIIDEERLFGSVSADMIQKALEAEGIQVDKNDIQLDEPIKKLGLYHIPVKLHPEVSSSCKVWVVKE